MQKNWIVAPFYWKLGGAVLLIIVSTFGWTTLRTAPDTAQAAELPVSLVSPLPGKVLSQMSVDLRWVLPQGAAQYHLEVVPAKNDGLSLALIRNAASSFTIVSPPSWYFLLPDMTYTWRVRATDATVAIGESDSRWGQWSSEWTFRTPATTSVGITALSPVQNTVLTSTNPVIQWQHPDPAIFYFEVQVSGDPTFNTDPATATSFVWWNLVHGGTTSPPNSWDPPLLEPGKTYYWRVRPRIQGDGAPVAWSRSFSFQTSAASRPAPPSVTLFFPGSGQYLDIVRACTNATARSTIVKQGAVLPMLVWTGHGTIELGWFRDGSLYNTPSSGYWYLDPPGRCVVALPLLYAGRSMNSSVFPPGIYRIEMLYNAEIIQVVNILVVPQ